MESGMGWECEGERREQGRDLWSRSLHVVFSFLMITEVSSHTLELA